LLSPAALFWFCFTGFCERMKGLRALGMKPIGSFVFYILVQEMLLTEGADVGIESQKEIRGQMNEKRLSIRLSSHLWILHNHDQSVTSRLVPLSATIDTKSIVFKNIKASFTFL